MTTPKRLRAIKDRRSTWARRHKALANAFATDLGDKLSAADRSFADHAATVGVECERMKARQLNDGPVEVDELVRLTNALTRLRIELSKRAKPSADSDLDRSHMQEEADRLEQEQRSADQ